MDDNKKNLTPEEELDRLLEQFLAEDDPVPAQEPASADALWQDINAENPTSALEPEAGADTRQEIGPDEDALAALRFSRSTESPTEPDWSQEPTAVIPDTLRTAPLKADSPQEQTGIIPDTGAGQDDPLLDPTLRQLLFEDSGSFRDDEFRDTFGEVEEIYSSTPEQPQPAPEPEPESEPEPQPQEAQPVRKRRPKNKRAYGFFSLPHLAATLIWLVLVVAIGASLGRMVWLCAADVLAFGRPDQTVYITITKTDTLDTVAEKLHRAGLINYPGLFKIYGQLTDIMDDLSIGTYELNTLYDYHALSTSMSEKPAMRVTVDVTIPEGYNCQQIFALLEQKEVCSAAELEQYACTSAFADYWFLEGTPRGTKYCLEGFLFPDTYEFYVDSDAKEVFIKLLAAFDYRFTDTMKEKLDKLNETMAAKMKKNGLSQSYIDSHTFTIREVVIIASLIEKETSGIEDDSYNISSVIYNRLTNPTSYPYLQLDSTLVYYTGRNELTSEDFRDNHPYNSYTQSGLIPGPISNPGRASLDAALDPTSSSYYYFILNPTTGTHEFSKTYEEHQKKAEEFARLEK